MMMNSTHSGGALRWARYGTCHTLIIGQKNLYVCIYHSAARASSPRPQPGSQRWSRALDRSWLERPLPTTPRPLWSHPPKKKKTNDPAATTQSTLRPCPLLCSVPARDPNLASAAAAAYLAGARSRGPWHQAGAGGGRLGAWSLGGRRIQWRSKRRQQQAAAPAAASAAAPAATPVARRFQRRLQQATATVGVWDSGETKSGIHPTEHVESLVCTLY